MQISLIKIPNNRFDIYYSYDEDKAEFMKRSRLLSEIASEWSYFLYLQCCDKSTNKRA